MVRPSQEGLELLSLPSLQGIATSSSVKKKFHVQYARATYRGCHRPFCSKPVKKAGESCQNKGGKDLRSEGEARRQIRWHRDTNFLQELDFHWTTRRALKRQKSHPVWTARAWSLKVS